MRPDPAARADFIVPPPAAAWRRWLPGLARLVACRLDGLRHDLVAGVVLTAVLVPVGLGYAQACGLPVIHGLYASIAALVAYAAFGPSRYLIQGPDSSLTALIVASTVPLVAASGVPAAPLAALLALLAGALCALAGRLRLGLVTDLLSRPIRQGYLHGIVLTVLAGQLPRLLGVPTDGSSLLSALAHLASQLLQGRVHGPTLTLGLGTLAVILLLRRRWPALPGVLIALVAATLLIEGLGGPGASGVAVVGALPQGLPSLAWPPLTPALLSQLLPGAVAIALVASADTSVLSRTYAARTGDAVDSNQELIALGAANLAAGLFQGFPVSASASRTPVAEAAGARSPLTGLVGAACIAGLLLWAPGLIAALPQAALAAVVIAACLSLVDLPGWQRLHRQRRSEWVQALVALGGVALFGVVSGIFMAVGLALMMFVWRAWRPHDAVLGRVDGLKGYHDITRHPEARRIDGLVLFRWDAPLFFANAEVFRERVLQVLDQAPTPPAWLVVLAEPVTDIDTTAAEMLLALDARLKAAGVHLCFAEMKGPVKDRLRHYGLYGHFERQGFFPTVGQAVSSYLKATGVPWHDWDEHPAGPPRGGAEPCRD
ncbi:SulP family inorganic anion transporter [Sphaerotilus hippei]|uniref:SulP family inorganic anion transporter n=1 Tax=Sphaerotilus hippei TaxID=744406 RepID=UPI000D76D43D|nr:SulP family inorganic anion transporter [Sphaerotilus hippei]